MSFNIGTFNFILFHVNYSFFWHYVTDEESILKIQNIYSTELFVTKVDSWNLNINHIITEQQGGPYTSLKTALIDLQHFRFLSSNFNILTSSSYVDFEPFHSSTPYNSSFFSRMSWGTVSSAADISHISRQLSDPQ